MSQDLSSAGVVIGALRVNVQSICTFLLCVHLKKLQFFTKTKTKREFRQLSRSGPAFHRVWSAQKIV